MMERTAVTLREPDADAAAVRELIRRARALIVDFDGTLVDSNPIKWRAFEQCFEEFPERYQEIIAYCSGHHHTPRGEKFRHVYERILERAYSPAIAARLHRRFAEETTQAIIRAAEIPGATGWLAAASATHRMALLSSTPHEILLEIVTARGWQGYFEAIQGAPVHKASWLTQFRQAHRLGARDAVFLGDTLEDAQAAQDAGCLFIAVSREPFGAPSGRRIADFTSLGCAGDAERAFPRRRGGVP